MSNQNEQRKELEDKILSKRQQIEFEKTDMDLTSEFSDENRENPDVMEEVKNYDDPADSVVESTDMKSLKAAELDLQILLNQLKELGNG